MQQEYLELETGQLLALMYELDHNGLSSLP